MEDTNPPRLDQWTDFAGKWLKADMISAFPVVLVCNKVTGDIDKDNNAHLILEFAYNNKKWLWECNKTNQKFLKTAGIDSPKSLEMKKFTFNKIQVRNPSTKQMVDSLAIIKVE